jgi:hypothetical protein
MPPRHTEGPPPERSFWELLPRRNFRRVLFLLLVLVAVVALKRSGAGSFRSLLDSVAPPPPPRPAAQGSAAAPATFQPMQVLPRPGAGGAPP